MQIKNMLCMQLIIDVAEIWENEHIIYNKW